MATLPPFVLTISVDGQEALSIGLSRFADAIKDFKPFWDEYFKSAWYRTVDTHYVTQGRSTGEAWAPLSERYGVWKQKHWPGLPVGVLSGATRESLTFANDANAVWEPTDTSLEVGTRVPHATYLQRGTGRMPARPPLRVGQEFLLQVGKLLQEFGVKTAREQGLAFE